MKRMQFLLWMICVWPLSNAEGAVIYRETFGRPVPTANFDMHPSEHDWADFNSAGSWVDTTGTVNFGINGSTDGRPSDVANVNAGPNSDGTTGAYGRGIHFFLAAGGSPTLAMTPEYSFDPGLYDGLSFSFYAANASASDTMRLAVEVGGQWYASAQQVATAALGLGAFPASAELKTFNYDPAAANWLAINFDGSYDTTTNMGANSSGPLSLGAAPGAPLSGMITGFGVYLDTAVGTRRFDTFEINGRLIPEPAAAMLLSIAGLILALIRRRG